MTSPAASDAFPPVSRDDWAAAVTADLGPDTLARRLRFTTEDGVALDALQTGSEAGTGAGVGEAVAGLVSLARRQSPFAGALGVRQRLDASSVSIEGVKDELAGGADSVEFGLARLDPASVAAKLAVLAEPVIEAGPELALQALPPHAWPAVLPRLLEDRVRLSAGVDPFAAWIASGASEDAFRGLAALQRLAPLVTPGSASRLLRASSEPWFDAGASTGWALALALAAGLEYLQALVRAGVERGVAAGTLELELALGADLLEGIAATRAARLVWARALEVAGAGSSAPVRLVATAGGRIFSRRDPWTNALRETSVAFSAAIGGADAVRLPAFDARTGSSAGACRLARNTTLILREEAGLARIVDPAGGSWYFDAATGALAERVWEMLAEIDAAGGLVAALGSGLVEHRLAAQRTAREAAVRRRVRPITGVSEFPDRRARPAAIARHATPLPARFDAPADAEPFERLQDAADSHAAAQGARARVLLVRLGSASESAARVAFARGVVAAGGLEPVVLSDVSAAEQVAKGFTESGASAAVLCGSDAGYATDAARIAAALKASGARLVLLTGRPGAEEATQRAAGIDDFVFRDADVVMLLERLLHAAGVLP